MNGAAPTFTITSGTGATGGLEGITDPAVGTGGDRQGRHRRLPVVGRQCVLDAHGEPDHPAELQSGRKQPAVGPLFGVQFSQLSCSDLNQHATAGTIGPKRSPLGLAADPGGLPLYKNGTLVGGVGAIADAIYSLDIDIQRTGHRRRRVDRRRRRQRACRARRSPREPDHRRRPHAALRRFRSRSRAIPALAPPFAVDQRHRGRARQRGRLRRQPDRRRRRVRHARVGLSRRYVGRRSRASMRTCWSTRPTSTAIRRKAAPTACCRRAR